MAERRPNIKKKHHYVPKFLLRNFGVGGSDRQVGVYHFPSRRFVAEASIRDQGQRHLFYGEQAVEDALSVLEGAAARYIGAVIDSGGLPARDSEGHQALVAFAFFQAARTPYAAEAFNEQFDKTFKYMVRDDPEIGDDLDELEFRAGNAATGNLVATAELLPLVHDLGYKVLFNRTQVPFVLSDHPAVLYNQFLEPQIRTGCNTGMAVRGLQLFLPLSPRHVLAFFDRDVYDVGRKRPKRARIDVFDENDAHALNILQAVSADECLYFNHEVVAPAAEDLVRKAAPYRPGEKGAFRAYVPADPQSGAQGTLVHAFRHDVRTGLKLRSIALSRRAAKYFCGQGRAPYRDPWAVAAFEATMMGEAELPPLPTGLLVPDSTVSRPS